MQTRTAPSLSSHDNISILAIIGSGIIGVSRMIFWTWRYVLSLVLGLKPIGDAINDGCWQQGRLSRKVDQLLVKIVNLLRSNRIDNFATNKSLRHYGSLCGNSIRKKGRKRQVDRRSNVGASTFSHFVSFNKFIVNYLSHFHGSVAAAARPCLRIELHTPSLSPLKGPYLRFQPRRKSEVRAVGTWHICKTGAALSMQRSKKRTIGSVTGRRNLKTLRVCVHT